MAEQTRYQVRFDWGSGGARAVGSDADVLVHVDVVRTSDGIDLSSVAPAAILRSDFRSARATAAWIFRLQQQLRRRVRIAVIAAGSSRADGSLRCDVEDLLAAGAVIASLGEHGIDATSPEAAAAEAAYRTLASAAGHLVSAGVTATTVGVPTGLTDVDVTLSADDADVVRAYSV